MELNVIQEQIFKNLSKEKEMQIDSYITSHSEKYIGKQIKSLAELSEKEADEWITKAYVESLG